MAVSRLPISNAQQFFTDSLRGSIACGLKWRAAAASR